MKQTGVDLIAAERQRQMYEEGYDAKHDSGHSDAIASAAACYAIPDARREGLHSMLNYQGVGATVHLDLVRLLWRWDNQYWKPGLFKKAGQDNYITPDGEPPTPEEYREIRIRQLVKAGALIAAAIDSMQAEEPHQVQSLHIPFAKESPSA